MCINLTEREIQVLMLLSKGKSNIEISGFLNVSEHAVKKCVSSILSKLQIENRIQAAIKAIKLGIV